MRFICDKSTLERMALAASRAVDTRTSSPVLNGILIEATADTVSMTGYNMILAVKRVSNDVNVVDVGRIVLNSKMFLDIVKKLPDGDVSFECTDSKTRIKCGKAVFDLIGTDAEDYPALPNVEKEKEIQVKADILKSMISQTVFAVSDNETKPIHTGCLFDPQGDTMTVVATDGYRMSMRKEPLVNKANLPGFVVPGKCLTEIERIIDKSGDTVFIYPDEKHIMITVDDTTFISRVLDGEFLNYRSIIPDSFQHEVFVNREGLVDCVERVSLIITEKVKTPVRIHFQGDVAKMSCLTNTGKICDECVLEGEVSDLEIGFNKRYLLEALRAIPCDIVKLCMNGPLNSLIISGLDTDAYTYLVLPVRMSAA